MILRVYYQTQGASVRLQVFTPGKGGEFRPAGNLVLSAIEFLELARGNIQPEFIEVKDGLP